MEIIRDKVESTKHPKYTNYERKVFVVRLVPGELVKLIDGNQNILHEIVAKYEICDVTITTQEKEGKLY